MRVFECPDCGNLLYFENTRCEGCGGQVGYLPEEAAFKAIPTASFRLCVNAQYDSCNWLIATDDKSEFCLACRHNRTIPDLSIPENLAGWRLYERAKHRLIYSLLALRLSLPTRSEDSQEGLAFDFLTETPDNPKVITGHDHGLITLNLKEANDVVRVKVRCALNEPYRTLLGHLRHESGHYVWGRLVSGTNLRRFRELFGDETQDYDEALKRHYAGTNCDDWRSQFISAYAASHPWEDFAETWAHYLHIIDTMEMASAFGVRAKTAVGRPPLEFPIGNANFQQFTNDWLSLTVVMNSLNQCMGHDDLYPFVLPPPVVSKLEFIHFLLAGRQLDVAF